MLRFAILQLLYRTPLTGYEIKKRFDTTLAFCWHASHAQIYPELHRMEKEGLVVVHIEEQVGKPNRNVYTITEQGKKELKKWLEEPIEELKTKDELLLKVFSIHLMEPQAAHDLLQKAKALHEKRLSEYREIWTSMQAKYFRNGKPVASWIYGRYFDLKQGMMYEQMYLDWIEFVEEQLRQNAPYIFEELAKTP